MSVIEDKNEFFSLVERERARADRMGYSFSILVFDQRELKKLDRDMRSAVGKIRGCIRIYDDIGIIDSSRISILMPHTGHEQAGGIAEKIRAALVRRPYRLHYSVLTYPGHWDSGVSGVSGSARDCLGSWTAADRLLREKLGLNLRRLPAWKRLMDIIGAAFGLALLSPLLLLVAAHIRAVSPGPVLFRQERLGYLGTAFSCYKFRTMHLGAPTEAHTNHLIRLISSDEPLRKLDAVDPRIIPMGKLLRVTGIDELPQLLNVLRGDMSLVGPRPCIPYEARLFKPWQRRRFDIMPGITGLWQVNGKNRTSFTEMIRYDLRYGATKNFITDCIIFFKTVPAIFAQVLDQKKSA